MKDKHSAWSQYWSANKNSCIGSHEEQKLVDRLWQSWLATIASGGKVLDLATGNGAVIHSMLAAGTSHTFTAVDYADIKPNMNQLSFPENVEFTANIDIALLPFSDESFDGISSQFGFEYADISKASAELVRVLKKEGRFQLIVHHQTSEILKANITRLDEIAWLIEEQGVIDSAIAYVHGSISQTSLEKIGQEYLSQHHGKLTKTISGNVFESINQAVLDYYSDNKTRATQSIKLLQARLQGEFSRLTQLADVAMSKDAVDKLVTRFENLGAKADATELKTADELTLGWHLTGSRK
ncbi:class I SAM-dependent methyltransferase [Thalassotalea sp. M1531]|uniref:Class I SAM-dependent methyltransferase n=1 Tax=Thalassotalea algicola TaxID=2716224 RepID=A0A7Y0LFN1_9GAMM|nr:class I SAM-dependent methyltransferase [Thalassotalea algicola]NMP33367.1 class I SAM-dependent methyltransferase [Thalassotalea algicola]